MSIHYVNRDHDEEIIDLLRDVLNNGIGKAETFNEHILIKLMQLRGTPITSLKFDQEKVNKYYDEWLKGNQSNEYLKCYNIEEKIGCGKLIQIHINEYIRCGTKMPYGYELCEECENKNKLRGFTKEESEIHERIMDNLFEDGEKIF